jgi:ankyrin repeat protein
MATYFVVMRRLAVFLLYTMSTFACHLGPASPARSAASASDVAKMTRLLDAGLDPNARNDAGYTPLIAASRTGDVPMIRLLRSRGADPNLRDAAVNGWTPLLHAIHKAQPGSVSALLDTGADPNGTERDGSTPLMMAAGYGYTDIVKILLAHGANPRIATNDGITALDLARSGVPDIDRFTVFACQDDTVKALLAADPKLPDHTANLPLPARIAMHAKRCKA